MEIRDVLTGDVHTCEPHTDLRTVASMMVDHDCGAIPVVAEGEKARPLGVVTDRDIVARGVARGEDPRNLKASDVMTTDPITMRRDESLERAMELMSEHRVRRVLVLDESETLEGVVSLADVVRTRPDQDSVRTVESVSQPTPGASGPSG